MTGAQVRNVLIFATCLAVAVVVLSREERALGWLRRATYFTMFGVTGAWLLRWIAWARARWASPAAALRANWPEILLAVAAMAALFLTHDWEFKVLSDETNMVGVARSLAQEWRFDFAGQAKVYVGSHSYLDYTFDKRPPLFMFVLSLVDSIFGYRVRNVWLLNGVLLGATIVVASGALRRRLGRPWNLLAVVCGLANPVVIWTASAAGVEPILCLVWAFAGFMMLETLEDPESTSFPLLIATVVLLGLARIEAGPLAALMLGATILASPARAKLIERFRDDWFVWTAPAAAMPVVLQQVRLRDYFQGTKVKPFGLEHVLGNVTNWRKVLADSGRFYPFNTLVTVAEVLAVVALIALVLSRRDRMSKAERTAFLIFAALTTCFMAFYTAYFWGQPTKATSARFYALPFFFAGLTIPPVLMRLHAIKDRPAEAAVVVGLVFAHAFPAAYSREFVNALNWRKEHMIVTDFLFPRLPGRSVLLVTQLPGQFLIYDVGAITFDRFNTERKDKNNEIHRPVYDEVLFVQELSLKTGHPNRGFEVDSEVKLETMLERQFDGRSFLRISRMVRDTPPAAHEDTPAVPAPAAPAPPPAPASTEQPTGAATGDSSAHDTAANEALP
jgi:hypothetical protein